MARSRKEDVKSKGERQQVILRLVQGGIAMSPAGTKASTPKRREGLKRSFMNPCWG